MRERGTHGVVVYEIKLGVSGQASISEPGIVEKVAGNPCDGAAGGALAGAVDGGFCLAGVEGEDDGGLVDGGLTNGFGGKVEADDAIYTALVVMNPGL